MSTTEFDPRAAVQAIHRLDGLLTDLKNDANHFGAAMHPYTLSETQRVAAERSKRASGDKYNEKTANENVAHGATTDWTNPFGRTEDADLIFEGVDQVRDSANKDHAALVASVEYTKKVLKAALDAYQKNEHQTKQDVDQIFQTVRKQEPGMGSAAV